MVSDLTGLGTCVCGTGTGLIPIALLAAIKRIVKKTVKEAIASVIRFHSLPLDIPAPTEPTALAEPTAPNELQAPAEALTHLL